MQGKWIIQAGNKELILFFGGWGMDEQAVSHLGGSKDVWMFYDYRDMETLPMPGMESYEAVYLVAWSMGVWAASAVSARMELPFKRRVALNGTERPVDDCYGIPLKAYLLTEQGMDEKGRVKFFNRMFTDKAERKRFEEHLPQRDLAEQLAELRAIRKHAVEEQSDIKWEVACISEDDKIFPAVNQENWWHNRTDMIFLKGGHYPFFQFEDWDSIICYGNR